MSDKKNVLIEVKDLCKSFDDVKVLNGISTTISQGEVVAIIGRPVVENLHFCVL